MTRAPRGADVSRFERREEKAMTTFGRRRTAAITLVGALCAFMGVQVPPALAAPAQISYVVIPHPDDEWQTWGLVRGSYNNYKVFIFMTQGEETTYCLTDAQDTRNTSGPHGYQGPRSPTNPAQPDYGETNPLGSYGDPWQGLWSSGCKQARRSGARAFIYDHYLRDGSIPNLSSPARGTYSLGGNTRAGLAPLRKDRTTSFVSRSAIVHTAPNGMGAAVFFDLGDGDLMPEEVEWAINAVRANKSLLGIPNLPDYNVIGAHWNNNYPNCLPNNHPDHRAIHTALWNYNLNTAGPQYGRTCESDPDRSRTADLPLQANVDNWLLDPDNHITGQRRGPQQRRYGWLRTDGWEADSDSATDVFGYRHHFWTRY